MISLTSDRMCTATVCVAVAEGGRAGENRQLGVFDNRPELLRKLACRALLIAMLCRAATQMPRLACAEGGQACNPQREPNSGHGTQRDRGFESCFLQPGSLVRT